MLYEPYKPSTFVPCTATPSPCMPRNGHYMLSAFWNLPNATAQTLYIPENNAIVHALNVTWHVFLCSIVLVILFACYATFADSRLYPYWVKFRRAAVRELAVLLIVVIAAVFIIPSIPVWLLASLAVAGLVWFLRRSSTAV